MDEIITKYWEVKYQQDILDKKMEKIKTQLKLKLKEYPDRKYETKDCVALVKSSKRTSITKKDVPASVWEQYSVCTAFDMLNVRRKTK